MQLISKVEVKYLRSLYELSVDKVGDLNVIFGRNDSGKSNLLRALNLFFNGKTEPYQSFDFGLDMSDPRKSEARSAKGKQFFWIKVTFSPPSNYQNALGTEITIKKQWNRDGNVSQTTMGSRDIPQARLTRFLNLIDFTYIPAVKDMNVYADLIERMYGAAAETPELTQATTDFIDAISGRASALTTQLTRMFATDTRLAPPTDMARLFRNLDFSHGQDRHSLFRQKGDGVKARHLPELLHFINQNEAGNKFYLWGFEEPENSLDLGAAKEEAARFAEFGQRTDTQIFVTSHSPAFYLSETKSGATIRRYFITKQEKDDSGSMTPKNAAKPIDDLAAAEKEMNQAGLLQLPFVIRKMDEHQEELDRNSELQRQQAAEVAKLTKTINDLNAPTLFVEGKHDTTLFLAAMNRLGKVERVTIRDLGGTPKDSAFFKAVLANGGINTAARTLFLFDNDKAGRVPYRSLCQQAPGEEPAEFATNAFAFVLPFSNEFKSFKTTYRIDDQHAFFTAEFLYPAQDTASLCAELVKGGTTSAFDDWQKCIHGDYHKNLGQSKAVDMRNASEGTPDWFFARGVPEGLKQRFSDECVNREFDTSAIDAVAKKVADTLL